MIRIARYELRNPTNTAVLSNDKVTLWNPNAHAIGGFNVDTTVPSVNEFYLRPYVNWRDVYGNIDYVTLGFRVTVCG